MAETYLCRDSVKPHETAPQRTSENSFFNNSLLKPLEVILRAYSK